MYNAVYRCSNSITACENNQMMGETLLHLSTCALANAVGDSQPEPLLLKSSNTERLGGGLYPPMSIRSAAAC